VSGQVQAVYIDGWVIGDNLHVDKAPSFLTPVVPFHDFTVRTGILLDEVNSTSTTTTSGCSSMDNEMN
jgi:hypothetical protein